MRIIIISEGGIDIGFGHITRCLSLYDAFKIKGIIPELIVSADKPAEEFIKVKRSIVFDWLKEQERLFEIIANADAVFIDSYKAGYEFYDKVTKIARLSVFIDDNKRLNYPAGIILNGSIGAESFCFRKRKGSDCFLGTRFIPIRREFWAIPKKSIKTRIKCILLTFGGVDHRNLTSSILKILVKEFPMLMKIVIVGSGCRNLREIERAKDRNTKIIYKPHASLIKKNMFTADIAISAGGQTLYELARVGVPTIAIAVANNQVNNIRGWKREGFIEFAGYWNNKDLEAGIFASIENLKDRITRFKKSQIGRALVDGRGSQRIADLIIRKCKKR